MQIVDAILTGAINGLTACFISYALYGNFWIGIILGLVMNSYMHIHDQLIIESEE